MVLEDLAIFGMIQDATLWILFWNDTGRYSMDTRSGGSYTGPCWSSLPSFLCILAFRVLKKRDHYKEDPPVVALSSTVGNLRKLAAHILVAL